MTVEKIEQKEEKLNQAQISDLFRSIIMGNDITETIDTSKGKFKIKYPRTRDLQQIAKVTAARLNGIPASCFDVATYSLIQEIAALDVLVIEGPSWYELAKKENKNFGWSDIPSQEFIQEVYALAYSFRQKVQSEIDGNKEESDREMADGRNADDNNKSGLFEGLAGKA